MIYLGLNHIHVHLFNLLRKVLLLWLLTLFSIYQMFGWINNLYGPNFINVHTTPPSVLVHVKLPYPLFTTLVPPLVVAPTPTTAFLPPTTSASPYAFAQSFCCTLTSSLQSPKILSIQEDLLWTCNFAPPMCYQKPSSCLCQAQVWWHLLLLMLLLYGMMLPSTLLTILQPFWLAHWASRSYSGIFMGVRDANDIPRGSKDDTLSYSGLLLSDASHMDSNLWCQRWISWISLSWPQHAWDSRSCTTWSEMEEQTKDSFSSCVVLVTTLSRCGM